jgi:hypothetical protein
VPHIQIGLLDSPFVGSLTGHVLNGEHIIPDKGKLGTDLPEKILVQLGVDFKKLLHALENIGKNI